MATPINFYWYKRKELSIQRDQANQQKAEFEKEIEKLLFDNREIKEHSRKTQRELSKEISSLTSELKDERDRIHELQKENRKLRQEVKPGHKTECPTRKKQFEIFFDLFRFGTNRFWSADPCVREPIFGHLVLVIFGVPFPEFSTW